MIAFRTQVKFFAEDPQAIELGRFVAVFQRLIQQQALEGMLIDVADYQHVIDGPGVLLIAHDGDYAAQKIDGRLGVAYIRKRRTDASLPAQLRTSFRLALIACALLEKEPSFRGKLKFRTDEAEIRLLDRLQFPNQPGTLEAVKEDLQAAISDVYGATATTLAAVSQDVRQVFTVSLHADSAATIPQLLDHLQPSLQE